MTAPSLKTPSVRSLAPAGKLVFSENGPGIPVALSERVFDLLFSGREGGRRMGLTILKNIVSVHGGSIELIGDRRRRRGAVIRILFPRKLSRATIHTK